MIFAQIPGAETAIKTAAGHGWEATFLVVLVIAFLTGTWFLGQKFWMVVQKILDDARLREERLATRVTDLENQIHEDRRELTNGLTKVIGENSAAMTTMLRSVQDLTSTMHQMVDTLARFTAVLESRPCLLAQETLSELAAVREKQHGKKPEDETEQDS